MLHSVVSSTTALLAFMLLCLIPAASAEYGLLVSQWNSGRLCMTVTKSSKLRLARCSKAKRGPPANQLWKLTNDGRLISKLDPTMCAVGTGIDKIVRLAPCLNHSITMEAGSTANNFRLNWKNDENCLTKRGDKRFIVAQPCQDRKSFYWKFVTPARKGTN